MAVDEEQEAWLRHMGLLNGRPLDRICEVAHSRDVRIEALPDRREVEKPRS